MYCFTLTAVHLTRTNKTQSLVWQADTLQDWGKDLEKNIKNNKKQQWKQLIICWSMVKKKIK